MKRGSERSEMFLFFDTETTGLSRNCDRIVQIAWLVTDRTGSLIAEHNYLVRPDGYEIPYNATRVHGITTERAAREGHDIRSVLVKFCNDIASASLLIGHNINFDVGILQEECERFNLALCLDRLHQVCTMRLSTHWCRIPKLNGSSGFKWPRLEELHYRLFGKTFAGAHDAMADVLATKRCFFELTRKGLIVIPSMPPPPASVQNVLRAEKGPEGTRVAAPAGIETHHSKPAIQAPKTSSDDELPDSSPPEPPADPLRVARLKALNPRCAAALERQFATFIEPMAQDGTKSRPLLDGDRIITELEEELSVFLKKMDAGGLKNTVTASNVNVVTYIIQNSRSATAAQGVVLGMLDAYLTLNRVVYAHAPAICATTGDDTTAATRTLIDWALELLATMVETVPENGKDFVRGTVLEMKKFLDVLYDIDDDSDVASPRDEPRAVAG